MKRRNQNDHEAAIDELIAASAVRVRSVRLKQRSASREPDLNELRLPHESTAEAKTRFQKTSKRNLNALLEWKPASAQKLGVEGRWLRRFQESGLGYASSASHESLKKLAEFFELDHFVDLWRDDLSQRLGLPGPMPNQVDGWKHSRYWKHAEMLLTLLDTGDYGHLATLVENLHELELSRSARHGGQDRPATKKTIAEVMKRRKSSGEEA